MSSITSTSDSPKSCTKTDCPLNEAGIPHSTGIYLHEGREHNRFCIILSNSNPLPFIWRCLEETGTAYEAIKESKIMGGNVKEAEAALAALQGTVERFLDYHNGCNNCSGCGHN